MSLCVFLFLRVYSGMAFFSAIFWISFLIPAMVSAMGDRCKCTPTSHCWPSDKEWSSLNRTIGGTLLQGVAPGSLCYPDQPNYDPEACDIVASQWFNSTWHAEDPVSIDYPIWTNNSCNPIWPNGTSITGDPRAGATGCSNGAYPAYVVKATTPEQISETLRWATRMNIRVVIKSTGHSYSGRSIGYGSLSIWTHHLRGIVYVDDFQPVSCGVKNTLSAVRVAAGSTGGEVQVELAKHMAIASTGANPDVGVVGWLTGGGHGPLSRTYGMGADNLLEARVITPDGQDLITNPCQHSDIFFAIRGGGGGTYGVITEVVIKTFPTPKTTSHTFKMTCLSPNSSTGFYDFLGFLHAEMQRLKEGGMQGYYLILGPPHTPKLSLAWTFMLFDKPDGTVEHLMEPIEVYLRERAHLFAYMQNIKYANTYLDIGGAFTNEAVANGGSAYGSRLLSAQSLANPRVTAKVLSEIGPSGNASDHPMSLQNPIIIGHMIASPDSPSYYPDVISMNPAWRQTLVHLIVVQSWPDGVHQDLIDTVYFDITYHKTELLRKLSPDTGAYFNEADAYELDWQQSLFGKNYDRLRSIKEKYDPNSVLWCRRCVGSEVSIELSDGRLCIVPERSTEDTQVSRDEPRRPGYYDHEGFGMWQVNHVEL